MSEPQQGPDICDVKSGKRYLFTEAGYGELCVCF